MPCCRSSGTASPRCRGIDPAVLEAADGLGMTRRQRLMLVELPLGAPVILAGIRTAAVWTIGAATLATTVGQPSLGNLIFSGLQTENWVRVLAGCAAAAALALIVDGLLALVEAGLAAPLALARPARPRRSWSPRSRSPSLPLVRRRAARGETVVIGAKNFSEQYILASVIERRLQAAGYRTERRDNLGSTVAYQALAAGDIDVYVDYSGTLWTNILQRTDTPRARGDARDADRRAAPRATACCCSARSASRMPMRWRCSGARAEALGVRTLDDLDPRRAAASARRRPRIPDPARMALGRRAATACTSPASAPTARPSCTAPSPTARPT